jgi:hypothetical protein
VVCINITINWHASDVEELGFIEKAVLVGQYSSILACVSIPFEFCLNSRANVSRAVL